MVSVSNANDALSGEFDMNCYRPLSFALAFCLAVGCEQRQRSSLAGAAEGGDMRPTAEAVPPRQSLPPASDHGATQSVNQQLLNIAAKYKTWGRVDDEMRWAWWLCRSPNAALAHVSDSHDKGTHGQKLYSLFARDHDAYVKLQSDGQVKVGQTIVKESWAPEEVADPQAKPYAWGDSPWVIHTPRLNDHFFPYVRKDGKLFRASKQADLFVMTKVDPETPETDAGWVYATITPDGKTVTSSGRIESCMKCHQTKTDRLFGMAEMSYGR
jgi:hypothetical protein